MFWFNLISCCFLLLLAKGFASEYCEFSLEHLLCGKREISPRCGDPAVLIYNIVSEEEIEDILKHHNNYRNNVAGGVAEGANGTKFPQASNMEELLWDEELFAMADAFVKNCLSKKNCRKCIQTKRFLTSDNIHYFTFVGDVKETVVPWEQIVIAWNVQEAFNYDVNDVAELTPKKNKYGADFVEFGHLTQTIWATTRRVGCSRISFIGPESKKSECIAICIYGPTGNIQGKEVYKQGPPCSACDKSRGCSADYPNLCSPKGRDDKPAPPIEIDYPNVTHTTKASTSTKAAKDSTATKPTNVTNSKDIGRTNASNVQLHSNSIGVILILYLICFNIIAL